ncbi:UDP-glucose-glycoprotein glucosyltransferase isoform X2 [Brevipalpus obovatus]|uniref:UDP-glucose-glycoprotein glucosyltransferase isoform X2 n=1 Tax=Brevipalpus obovatus TaxID=246614 RepID=UPI003D9F3BCA
MMINIKLYRSVGLIMAWFKCIKLVMLILIVCGLINSLIVSGSVNKNPKSVTISLFSKWNQTSLYSETAEFLQEESDTLFWTFVDTISDDLSNILAKTSQDLGTSRTSRLKHDYNHILQLTLPFLPSNKKSILKFSLALRAYSPVVEMFNQISREKRNDLKIKDNECTNFVEFSRPLSSTTIPYGCDLDTISTIIDKLLSNSDTYEHPIIFKSDHIHPASSTDPSHVTAILYGDLTHPTFIKFHSILRTKSRESGRLKFLIRHYIPVVKPEKVLLSGYGAELAIKSTEYKAQDDTRVKGEASQTAALLEAEKEEKPDELEGFVFSKLKANFPEMNEKLSEFQSHLMESMKEIATLKVWELQDMSLQAAKKILTSPVEDQLNLMTDISQNFPSISRMLAKIPVDGDMKREVEKNQQLFMHQLNLGPSDSALFVNGMFFDMDTTDIYTLLYYLKKEVKLSDGLHKILGQNEEKIRQLIKLDITDEKQEYQIDIRDSAVFYINDIEADKTYRNWPSSLQDMLRPTYPGMLRNVRKNIYHLVLIVDPSKKEAFDVIKLAESFYVHKAPLRVGFIFAVNKDMSISGQQDAGVALLNAYNYIAEEKTAYEGLSFITDVIASATSDGKIESDLSSDNVISLFKAKFPKADISLVFGNDSTYDTGRLLAWDYLHRTGLNKPMKSLLNGVVLKDSHLNSELFEDAVLTEIMRQTPTIQKAIYRGELSDSNDVLDWLMSQKTVMPRLNQRILAENENILELRPDDQVVIPASESSVNSESTLSRLLNKIKYLSASESKCTPITAWIAANFESKEGQDILLKGLHYLSSSSQNLRFGLIYRNQGLISQTIEAAISSIPNNKAISFIIRFLGRIQMENSSLDVILSAQEMVPSEYSEKFRQIFKQIQLDEDLFKLHSEFVASYLHLNSQSIGIVLNGRIIEIPESETLIEDDFSVMEKHGMISHGQKILAIILEGDKKSDPTHCSNFVMKIASILMSSSVKKVRHDISGHGEKHSVIHVPPQVSTEPAIDLIAIVEPLSRGAQKLAPILSTLHKVFNARVKVFLNCIEKHSDMPLKNYFRFVIDSEMNFNEENNNLSNMEAHFADMPQSPLFTLHMTTAENWLVESVASPFDLDNIHLEEIDGPGVWADFELEYLLLEGHCFEQSTGNPPRGLQFVLGSKSNPNVTDTIVMANLGYFQLKANPGAWLLRLRSGRSDDIYNIVSHENTDPASDSNNVAILISTFRSNVVKIRVNKKPGKQNEELLYDSDEDDEANGLWDSLSSWTGGKKKQINETQDKASEKLNIFSLASGHLYERLLRIMMLSVLKQTKTPVKFWFLKNYLSPTFKDFLPFMAQTYGFEYELVQYKWPRWLHQQTEKQRIIWGYKILFLDVLFPLDVKKIIFVDADQVVRVDLTELRDLDLEGAPYGYTPFCDSREDMDGFRFWRTGYWASHLHGRKYHISALYVVDLQKFRRIAAGDRLRGQYQGLSQDPNSLSNLDQDLPNNMIHQVPIKSLPQEWLWCETWCDDGFKATAKTIDLCNNPKTKEPKLTAARRILPEWEGYDNEIKDLMEKWQKAKGIEVDREHQASVDISLEEAVKQHSSSAEHKHDHTEL